MSSKRPPTSVAAADGDDKFAPLAQLRKITEQRHQLELEQEALIRRARTNGLGWEMIATALGVSKQAVHKKYGKRT